MKTNQSNPWRIDAGIETYSYLKSVVVLVWLSIMLLMIGFSRLWWWQVLIMVMVILCTLVFYWLQRRVVSHITQPRTEAHNNRLQKDYWFVYVNTSRASTNTTHHNHQQALWQCQLSSVHSNKYVVILYFQVVSPYVRPFVTSVWRDQMTADEWRKLQVMARYF